MAKSFLFSVVVLALVGCSPHFQPNKVTSESSSSLNDTSEPTPTPTPTPTPEPAKLGNIGMTFAPMANTNSMTVTVVDGASYSLVLDQNGEIPMPAPVLIGLSSFLDNVGDATSLRLVYLEKGQTVETSNCSPNCAIFWRNGWTSKRCRADFSLWTFPEPGHYELIASYRSSPERKVGFQMADPCGNVIVGQMLKANNRVPASLPKPVKKK